MTYVGQTEFVQVSNPALNTPDWGPTTLTVRWKGAATELDDYLATLSKGDAYPDAPYTNYHLNDWSVDDNVIYPTVTLSYLGFVEASVTKRDLDWSIQTAQIGVDSASGGYTDIRRDVTYRAPTCAFSYFTNSQQDAAVNTTVPTFGVTTTVLKSVVTAKDVEGDDKTWYGNAPVGVVTATTLEEVHKVVSHKSTPFAAVEVPIWINEDVVAIVLEGGS